MNECVNAKLQRVADLKAALKAGRAAIGSFVALPSPGLVEALGYAGLHFVIIDMEHGAATLEKVEDLLRAADVAGTLPFVRVPAQRPDLVSRVLDCGAAGIVMPMVETASDLERAIAAMRFPPRGRRGMAPSVRAGAYGFLSMADFLHWSSETLLIAQIETVRAVENIDEIVATGGMDVVFIGPADLSTSYGVPGDASHPSVAEAIDRVIEKCQALGRPLGTIAADAAGAERWVRRGVPLIALSSTTGFRAVSTVIGETRQHLADLDTTHTHQT